MAKTPHFLTPASPSLNTARFVGRVGALAVALGIGLAIGNSPAVAAADDSGSSSERPSTQDSGSSDTTSSPRTDADPTDPVDSSEDSAEGAADREPGVEEEANEEPEDEELRDEESAEHDDDSTVEIPMTDVDADVEENDDSDDPPADPSPAVWAMAGMARRELGADTATASAQESATAMTNDSVTAAAVSPLGTPQQLEAERLAAQTIQTWPVKLMKAVLRAGWLAAASREYASIGGPDAENLARLQRAVDEYAMGAAFQQQLLNPMTPTVVTQVAPPHTWYGRQVGGSRILYDNPDTIYRFMAVNKTSTYVIRGRFTGPMPADTNFSVLTGLSGITAANLSGRELQISGDGSFTITVSGSAATPGQRNHLQLTSDSTLIAVRNTLSDWKSQPPMELSIERVAGPRNSLFSQLGGFAIPLIGPTVTTSPLLTALVSLIPPLTDPPPLLRGTFTAVVMALGLSMESKYIEVATRDPVTGEHVAPNVLRNPSRNAEFLATQLQSAGYFELEDHEALVVTIAPNNARYFTVPVTDLWTITDDYWNEQTSLNNAQAVANRDRTYTFVISSRDARVHNWVSTGGLNQGTISIRFQDLDLTSNKLPTVTAQVVSLRELHTVLPAGTRFVTSAQRQDQLALRKAGFNRRFAPYAQP